MYKDNLRYVIDKYSMLEVDVLIALSREQPNSVKPIPPYLDVLFKRILEDGLAELIVTGDALVIGHPEIGAENIKMNPDLLRITDKGKLFVDSISRQKIGYERES
jgi:hypothetical protein